MIQSQIILMISKNSSTMIALKKIFKSNRIVATLVFSLFSLPAWAQSNNNSFWTDETIFYAMVGLVFTVAVLVLIVAAYVLQLLKVFVRNNATEEELSRSEAEPSAFLKLWNKWNALRPMDEEVDIILDHDYDGIKELDNHLPPWWKGLFYLTIVYGVIYILVFHVFKSAPLQEEQYEIAMAKAEAEATARQATQSVAFDETNVTFTDAPADLEAGKKIFEMQCAPCHRQDGGGSVGPNLTDDYWKSGGSMKDIYNVIKVGVPSKGMIAWEQLLSPDRMRNVSSYIITLKGSNPPGAKAPQGDLFTDEEASGKSSELMGNTKASLIDAGADLVAGKKIYEMNCAPCHKQDGGGSIGPNLTDDYWVNGGSIKDIINIINIGIPSKGMIGWEQILGTDKVRDVSFYIKSLKGSNPPGAKKAEGDLYIDENAAGN